MRDSVRGLFIFNKLRILPLFNLQLIGRLTKLYAVIPASEKRSIIVKNVKIAILKHKQRWKFHDKFLRFLLLKFFYVPEP